MFKFSSIPDTTASRDRSPIERSVLDTQIRLKDSAYIPAVRWRMAEYQSLYHLPDEMKDNVVPLITIPPVKYDFEKGRYVRSVLEHVDLFISRFGKHWHRRACWLTVDNEIISTQIEGNKHMLDYLFHGLRCGELAIPTKRIDANEEVRNAITRINSIDQFGVGLIIGLDSLSRLDIKSEIDDLVSQLNCTRNDCDLIIDMGSPSYRDYDRLAKALSHQLSRIGDLARFRNFILIGTAIPSSFSKIDKGTDKIKRHDWLFYQYYVASLKKNERYPNYGDHTIVHPGFTASDMRGRVFLGKIVYATDEYWYIRKGGSFRADPNQMRFHCSEIINDPDFDFRGSDFSRGDQIIANCANGRIGAGNLTIWKHVGVIHHMSIAVLGLARN